MCRCRLIFLLLLMANIVPQYLLGDAAKCYKAFPESVDPEVIDCPSEETGACYLMKCNSAEESKSFMDCGKCPKPEILPSECKCNQCNEKDLCNYNQPQDPIKQCYGEGRLTTSGGFEYEKVECKWYNNDGCKTIEPLGGAKSARDLEKSCGKCPPEKDWPKGKECNHCDSGDSCNDKVVGKCYEASYVSPDPKDPTETNCLSDDCYLVQCSGSGFGSRIGCGTCSDQGHESSDCECTPCKGNLCNQPKDATKECYVGRPDSSGKYETENCKYYNNDGCHTKIYGDGNKAQDYQKSCGKCPKQLEPGYSSCTNCTGEFCNKPVNKGSINQCYVGKLDSSGKFGVDGEFEMEKCEFFNNDGCKTIELIGNSGNIEKSCGKCPKTDEPGRKCSDCTGDLCNKPVDKGTIKQCYGGDEGNYNEEDCKFYNNDGCHTIVCDDKKDKKGCGKCPPSEKLETMGNGCKCEECDGELCNKELTVNKCYWGDDQKGYEAIDCMAPHNTACKKVKCRGAGDYSIDPETGKRGSGFAKNYRECGKCKDVPDTCKCLQCNDKDLCNGGLRIGSPTFVLVMIGGVVALMTMKPLVGIGI